MGRRPTLLLLLLLGCLALHCPQSAGARKGSRSKRAAAKEQRKQLVELTPSGRDPRGGAIDPAAAAQAALAAVADDVERHCSIDRLPTIDVATFLSEYFQKQPLILTNASDNSAAGARWTLDYLRETYGDKRVTLGSPYASSVLEQPPGREKLGDYIQRLQDGKLAGGAEYVWHTVSRDFFSAASDESWIPLGALQHTPAAETLVVGAAVEVGSLAQLREAWEGYDSWSEDYAWQAGQPARVTGLDEADGTVQLRFVADRKLWSAFEVRRPSENENGCVIPFQSVFVTHVCPTPVWANRWLFHIHFTKTRTDGGIFLCDRRFTPRTSRTMKERPCRCSPWVALTLGSHSTFTKMATPRCCGVASSGVSTRRGQKNGSFEPFLHSNDQFTKTGSGQT